MFQILKDLIVQIKIKKKKSSQKSYTSFLLSNSKYLMKKILEESKELFDAAKLKNKRQIIHESADLLYHFLVLLESKKINFNLVLKELKKRKNISGFEEKKNRNKNVR
ncbi:MAG: phosphoribosyl-ATP diphosphatase [Pelagibacteraceae bacterium]|nr:MAG: phosphoribosyl-ATP diphosphatase [Pelagibacteraceae bacterium]